MSSSSIDRAQEEILELLEAGKSISGRGQPLIQTDPQVIACCCSNKEFNT